MTYGQKHMNRINTERFLNTKFSFVPAAKIKTFSETMLEKIIENIAREGEEVIFADFSTFFAKDSKLKPDPDIKQ